MENRSSENQDQRYNQNQKGVDKAPGEEKGKADRVTTKDLKGKKVDGDPGKEEDQPLDNER